MDSGNSCTRQPYRIEHSNSQFGSACILFEAFIIEREHWDPDSVRLENARYGSVRFGTVRGCTVRGAQSDEHNCLDVQHLGYCKVLTRGCKRDGSKILGSIVC